MFCLIFFRWDTGEDQERLSPWDMEPLSEDDDAAGSVDPTSIILLFG